MKVLIVNSSERTGGAAVAARRLMEALNNNGVKVKMLVRDKTTDNINVVEQPRSFLRKWNFLIERLSIFLSNGFNREHLFNVSIANTGQDITSLPEFDEAKIIHIHWTNQGMLSVKDIEKILKSGKRVVWTMHDMWAFTGICHYTGGCDNYKAECGHCPQIFSKKGKDLSTKIFRKKRKAYEYSRITFVGCSNWMADMAKQSQLIYNHRVVHIPNAINVNTFCMKSKYNLRIKFGLPVDKKLILFASMKVTDKRKGAQHIVEACEIIESQYTDKAKDVALVVFGKQSEELKVQINLPVYSLPFMSNEKEIAEIYCSADVFVIPSLQENLPNMVMESMSCGTPCVGFNIGGIPEMIDHKKNGYVAEYMNSQDIAEGIIWTIYNDKYKEISALARSKVLSTYSESIVARQYIDVYNSIGLREVYDSRRTSF